jgi:hypothetical protein
VLKKKEPENDQPKSTACRNHRTQKSGDFLK